MACTSKSRTERGNILFLILLAVVLFAALAYAVTSSMRGGGKDASAERAQSQASDLLNYFAQIDAAVQRMMMVGNVKDYEINFFYQTGSNFAYGGNDNTNCTESRCRVFAPDGGNVSGRKFPEYTMNPSWTIPRIFYVSVPGVGTSAPDIVMAFYKTKPRVCEAINQAMGLPPGILYNMGGITEVNSLMYHASIPVGPIPATTQTLASLPAHIGSLGTFCACHGPQDESVCVASGWYPVLFHVVVAR